jgi:dephospho-CoA kinase
VSGRDGAPPPPLPDGRRAAVADPPAPAARPLTVGLTGGIASGKSIVANMFVTLGAELVDTDLIAREVVAPGQPALAAIRDAFGDAVFTPTGALDRAALRRLIFADEAKRKQLDALLHPLIRAKSLERIERVAKPYAIVAVPLLVETNFGELVDRIVVVDSPSSLQLERLMRRDAVPRDEAAAAIAAQTDRATRLRVAHDVIDNSGDLEHTRRQVAQLHEHYVELAGRSRNAPAPKGE